MPAYRPTHLLVFTPDDAGPRQTYEVMLTAEGAAYSHDEWEADSTAEVEHDPQSGWSFGGSQTPRAGGGQARQAGSLSVEGLPVPAAEWSRIRGTEAVTSSGWYGGTLDGVPVRCEFAWGTTRRRRDHHHRIVAAKFA